MANGMNFEEIRNLAPNTRARVYSYLNGHEVYDAKILCKETGELKTLSQLEEEGYTVSISPKKSEYRADNYVPRLLSVRKESSKPKQSAEGFVLAMYESTKNLKERFASLNDADLGRLMYLSSFVAWSDNEPGRLQFDNNKWITRYHFAELVGMSERRANDYLMRLQEANVLIERDGNLYMNEDVFYYGSAKRRVNPTLDFMRVYKSAIRDIYTDSGTRAAGQLSLIYSVLPYVNRATNVLCLNPNETNEAAVNFLTLKQLAELLGYANPTKLKTAMNGVRLRGEAVFCFTEDPSDRRQTFITINPNVIFGGNEENRPLIESYFHQGERLLAVA